MKFYFMLGALKWLMFSMKLDHSVWVANLKCTELLGVSPAPCNITPWLSFWWCLWGLYWCLLLPFLLLEIQFSLFSPRPTMSLLVLLELCQFHWLFFSELLSLFSDLNSVVLLLATFLFLLWVYFVFLFPDYYHLNFLMNGLNVRVRTGIHACGLCRGQRITLWVDSLLPFCGTWELNSGW